MPKAVRIRQREIYDENLVLLQRLQSQKSHYNVLRMQRQYAGIKKKMQEAQENEDYCFDS